MKIPLFVKKESTILPHYNNDTLFRRKKQEDSANFCNFTLLFMHFPDFAYIDTVPIRFFCGFLPMSFCCS